MYAFVSSPAYLPSQVSANLKAPIKDRCVPSGTAPPALPPGLCDRNLLQASMAAAEAICCQHNAVQFKLSVVTDGYLQRWPLQSRPKGYTIGISRRAPWQRHKSCRQPEFLQIQLSVVQLFLHSGMAPPAPPQGLYDRDLSQASLAAAQAIADLQDKPEPWSGIIPQEDTARNSQGKQQETVQSCTTEHG